MIMHAVVVSCFVLHSTTTTAINSCGGGGCGGDGDDEYDFEYNSD
jgi:hypothetical protein